MSFPRPSYPVERDGFGWTVYWDPDDSQGLRYVVSVLSRRKAQHIADHLLLAYHYGVVCGRDDAKNRAVAVGG